MKHLLAFFTAIMLTSFAYADCSSSALWVFPNEKTIKQNPVFVLEGYAQSQKIIPELNKTYPVYLKSGSKKVKLLVSEICTGQFYVTQAVLRPETELEAGLDYTICIDNLPEGEGLKRYNGKTQLYESISYRVNAGKDTEKPQLASKPKEIRKTLIHFGCGPSIHVVFDNPAKDDSPVIVGTTVKNLKTGTVTCYYVMSDGKQINVGHDMCSGAFTYDDSNAYEVEFSFMDASGNVTAWTGDRIRFTKPTKETPDE